MNRTTTILAGLGLLLISGVIPVTAWTVDLSASSGGRTGVLTLGSEDGASDEFDVGLDIPLPPPPPSSSFSAHLVGNGLFEMLQTDIRTTHSWSVYVTSRDEIDITWSAAPIPLMMTLGDDKFSLAEAGHRSLSSGEYRISIQGAQSPSLSRSASSPGDGSHSYDLASPKASPATDPSGSSISPAIPDQIPDSMSLPPTIPAPDTPVRITSDLTSDTLQTSHSTKANQTSGFGAILTLIGVGALIFTLKKRQMK